MEMDVELWTVVTEFPNYEVSNRGRVRTRGARGRIAKQHLDSSGLAYVRLWEDGLPYARYVHLLCKRLCKRSL